MAGESSYIHPHLQPGLARLGDVAGGAGQGGQLRLAWEPQTQCGRLDDQAE
jgi:hypothetical protein